MPRSAPYIPTKDSLLNSWLLNFSTLLTASPNTYGRTSSDATAVAAQVSVWTSAYTLVTSKSTKTADAVSAKNAAKVNTLALVRPIAVNISLNPAVASSDKIAIGVNPRTTTPTPITPPTTYPILTVQAGASLQLYLRFRDSAASVSVKSKPYGVASVQVRYLVSLTAITDPSLLTQTFTMTKSPSLLQFTQGGQCYLAAFYLLANGKASGFGPIVSFTVPTSA